VLLADPAARAAKLNAFKGDYGLDDGEFSRLEEHRFEPNSGLSRALNESDER
jgi:hypothetical protein